METILLVDENPLRASMRKTLLEGGDPTVVRARDAVEALCLVEAPEVTHSLMLVITGHMMTGISGPEFVAELRSRLPEVPILVLSALPATEKQYLGIPGVYHSQTASPEELRTTVNHLLSELHQRTA
jgi:CheY-like chemotaxis protein